jgi:hypothetical protein
MIISLTRAVTLHDFTAFPFLRPSWRESGEHWKNSTMLWCKKETRKRKENSKTSRRKGQGRANKYETRGASFQSGGKTLYGFRIPFGSNVCLIWRIMPIAAGDFEK